MNDPVVLPVAPKKGGGGGTQPEKENHNERLFYYDRSGYCLWNVSLC